MLWVKKMSYELTDDEKIFAKLTKDKIPEELSLDSTFVKIHQHGLGAITTQKFMPLLISNADRLNCS